MLIFVFLIKISAPIQMVSLFASFLSLIWNAMEWNWVGYELDQYIMMKIRKRLRLLPLYMFGSVYKSICLSVLVMYLKAYAIFPMSILVCALMATKYFFMKHMKRHRPMTRSFSRSMYLNDLDTFYWIRNAVFCEMKHLLIFSF